MSNPDTRDLGFFEQNGKIVFPILGILAFIVLVGGGYAIWRGPQRAFLPACLTRRLRRNIVDDESSDMTNEKRIPRRVETGRRAMVGNSGPRVSSADEFKREVVASLYGGQAPGAGARAEQGQGQMEWVDQGGEDQGRVRDGSLWGNETMAGNRAVNTRTSFDEGAMPASHLPRRRSSIGSIGALPVFADGSVVPPSSVYPSLPPTTAIGPPRHAQPARRSSYVPEQHVGSPTQAYTGRRISNAPEQYYTGPRRDHRASRAPHKPLNKPAYVSSMKDGQESDVW